MKKRVVLFTPFPPNIGGGAVILRSLLPKLDGLDVKWLYLSDLDMDLDDGSIRIGDGLLGGSLVSDLCRTALQWTGISNGKINTIVDRILAFEADVYWVVAHNEGILIANELRKRTELPIHTTVHDDTPYGFFYRSKRYPFFTGLAQYHFNKLLKNSSSIDVVSDSMRKYYQKKCGVDSVVVHRVLDEIVFTKATSDEKKLTVGHIGNIYNLSELIAFCEAVEIYAKAYNKELSFVLIGMSRKYAFELTSRFNFIVDIPHLEEKEAVVRLNECDFVYAMYPFDDRSKVFRETSQPTKLSTYILSRRPIFAHTPKASTLFNAITKYGIGICSDELRPEALKQKIELLLTQNVNEENFNLAQEELHGYENASRLARCLLK